MVIIQNIQSIQDIVQKPTIDAGFFFSKNLILQYVLIIFDNTFSVLRLVFFYIRKNIQLLSLTNKRVERYESIVLQQWQLQNFYDLYVKRAKNSANTDVEVIKRFSSLSIYPQLASCLSNIMGLFTYGSPVLMSF